MNRIIYSVIFIIATPFLCLAQDDDNYKWQANLYGGIYIENEQAWVLEPSISWHFHKYFGVSLGWEFTSQYNQPIRSTIIDGQNADLSEGSRDIAWMLFKPSIILKSPAIKLNKDGNYKLWFQAEPGVSLACPFRNSVSYEVINKSNGVYPVPEYVKYSNSGLRVFYWNARLSTNISIDRWVVGIGYEMSDFDYYSCRRNITLQNGSKFYVPKKKLSQSVLLSIGYKF